MRSWGSRLRGCSMARSASDMRKRIAGCGNRNLPATSSSHKPSLVATRNRLPTTARSEMAVIVSTHGSVDPLNMSATPANRISIVAKKNNANWVRRLIAQIAMPTLRAT